MSRRSGHAFSYSDRVHLALGWGAGHAACHGLFFFASLLPLTTGDGSLYSDTCPGASVFLVSALNCLGGGAALAAAMVVALEGWRRREVGHILFAPAAHLATALLVSAGDGVVVVWGPWRVGGDQCRQPTNPINHRCTTKQTLGSFRPGGCAFSLPAVLALGAAATLYAARMTWRNAPLGGGGGGGSNSAQQAPASAAIGPLAPRARGM
jgi:hypothetical protein